MELAHETARKKAVKPQKGAPSNAHIIGSGEVEQQLITDTLRSAIKEGTAKRLRALFERVELTETMTEKEMNEKLSAIGISPLSRIRFL